MVVSKSIARYGAAKEAIVAMIRAGEIGGGMEQNKLPSEDELSKMIGVSTGTVREALRILEMEGVVSKKHGAGNFFHPSTMDLKMRIDLMPDFKELLEDAGYGVRRDQRNFSFRPPSDREREVFSLDGEVLSFDLTYVADGQNAINTVNIVPRQLLTAGLYEIKEDSTLMELLWRHCRERISNSIEEIVPRLATEEEAEMYEITAGTPLIALDEVFYSYKDTPIGYATVSFNPKIMKMHLLRKWS